jgi:16S rRNA (adenine1518-N6/adenine1519-N6)-dimethyltransferase
MPLSPSQTRDLLDSLAHAPNKKLGQNFLIDGNIVRKSIELAGVSEGQRVVEIGPGLGTLSRAILESGASLWAVERDPTLAQHLRSTIAPEYKNFELIEGDCLDHPLAGLPLASAETGFSIVANLPYAVSTPWMEAVLSGPLPDTMVLMLQKEAGDRYAAKHGGKNFGAISIFLQSAYEVTGRHLVGAACFYPPPKVDSILLRLQKRHDAMRYSSAARTCIRRIFTQRRKQLGALCKKDALPEANDWFNKLLEQGISPSIRPEALPLQYWQQFEESIHEKS